MGYPNLIPPDYWDTSLGWRNLCENMGAVQLNHRLLAYTTASAAAAIFAMAHRLPLPPRVLTASKLVAAMVTSPVLRPSLRALGLVTL